MCWTECAVLYGQDFCKFKTLHKDVNENGKKDFHYEKILNLILIKSGNRMRQERFMKNDPVILCAKNKKTFFYPKLIFI